MLNYTAIPQRILKIVYISEQETEVSKIYWEIEQKCQRVTKKMEYFIFMNQIIFTAPLFVSIYFIFIGNFDTSTWALPLHMIVPFSRETIYGWYLLWFIQWCMGILYGLCTVIITAFFVCCCYYINGLCDHFNITVQSMSNIKSIQMKSRMNRNTEQEVTRKLCKALKVHVDLIE